MKNYKDQFKNSKIGDWVFDLLKARFYKISEYPIASNYPYKTDYDIFTVDGMVYTGDIFPRFFTLENAKEIISKLELDVEMPKTILFKYMVYNKKIGAIFSVDEKSIMNIENNDNYIIKKVEFEI
jgi:hypothetical protein